MSVMAAAVASAHGPSQAPIQAPIQASSEGVAPVSQVGDNDVSDTWCDRLLAMLDVMCWLMGCASDRPSLADLSGAIDRLAGTIDAKGVAPLTGSAREEALNAAFEAGVIADANSAALGLEQYSTLRATLDRIILSLATGPVQ